MSTRNGLDPLRVTRREAIHLLGVAGGLGILGSRELLSAEATTADAVQAAAAPFPKGIIVRTILEDVPAARLTGTTLFQEHLSITPPSGQPIDTGLITDEVRACAADGVSCIVDDGVEGLVRSHK